jgi:hypothetical protein
MFSMRRAAINGKELKSVRTEGRVLPVRVSPSDYGLNRFVIEVDLLVGLRRYYFNRQCTYD